MTLISTTEVTIRTAVPADRESLARLAELDSSRPLYGPVLAAEVEGEIWAAISLADERVIANPFRATAELVALLYERARQTRQARHAGRRRRRQRRSLRPALG